MAYFPITQLISIDLIHQLSVMIYQVWLAMIRHRTGDIYPAVNHGQTLVLSFVFVRRWASALCRSVSVPGPLICVSQLGPGKRFQWAAVDA